MTENLRLPRAAKLMALSADRGGAGTEVQELAARYWRGGDVQPPELPLKVTRLLMQDFTAVPAMVDLRHIRSAVGDSLDTVVPIDVVLDHSLDVLSSGSPTSEAINRIADLAANRERYEFLQQCARDFSSVRVYPPGSGICHQLNLEYLATGAFLDDEGRVTPELVCGTDSHTTMIGALGILGWGVGGLDAVSIALGRPFLLRTPRIVGIDVSGRIRNGVTVTDVALHITKLIRDLPELSGCVLEFHGPAMRYLSVEDRAVIANMAPEYGVLAVNMPVDEQTYSYLEATGRDHSADVMRELSEQLGLDTEASYIEAIPFDLSTVERSISGPWAPSQLLRTAVQLSKADDARPIVIASITSCTNTSNPDLMLMAGLLARNAVAAGIRVPTWVKTSLLPGSAEVVDYLRSANLLEPLETLGFSVAGFGCGTCNGNSGPLLREAEELLDGDSGVAVLSGNRNFAGRIHPQVDSSYLMSPALVVAYALAGRFLRSIDSHVFSDSGVRLDDIWPHPEEINRMRHEHVSTGAPFRERYDSRMHPPTGDQEADAEYRPFRWSRSSTFIRDIGERRTITESHVLEDTLTAACLLHLGDDISTDHISPGGRIPADSPAGAWLSANDVPSHKFGSYGSRRGNAEVMTRGGFTNPKLQNLLVPVRAGGVTRLRGSDDLLDVYDAASSYMTAGVPTVIVAGHRYGVGSSRDWAAKATRLLGVRAVIAASFERLHRINLINVGVIPIIADTTALFDLSCDDLISIDGIACALTNGGGLQVRVRATELHGSLALETDAERAILTTGGMFAHLKAMARANA